MAIVNGDNSNNTLTGGVEDDTLNGLAGNDILIGNGGADILDGGTGSDTASYTTSSAGLIVNLLDPLQNTGDAAGDTYISIEHIRGSAFADTLIGDGGNNALHGGAGADTLDGGDGFDYASYRGSTIGLIASLANPLINTGDAAGDTYTSIEGLIGSDFDDTLSGDGNVNLLRGGVGADALDGGEGLDFADYVDATTGVTVNLANSAVNTGEAAGDTFTSIEAIRGGSFSDTLIGDATVNILRGGLGADHLDGGLDFDFADYTNSTAGLTVNLANSGLNTGEATGDTFTSIEGLIGSSFADQLTGDANNNHLRGNTGADYLDGGTGFDYADYRSSAIGLVASLANPASNTGDAAGDTYTSIEGLVGSDFDDTLIGDSNVNLLRGGLGADALDGGAGFDFADYDSASSGVIVNLANSAANTGEAAGDTFTSIEGIRGGDFNDTLVGDGANNILRGGLGADVLDGGGGSRNFADYANSTTGLTANLADSGLNTGEAAGDTYISIQCLIGSSFADQLTGDANWNTLRGGAGSDHLDGGAGFDAADYSQSTIGLMVSLANPAANTGEAAGDTYTAIEGLLGSAFNDTLVLNNAGGFLQGGAGADTLIGGTGFDFAHYTGSTSGLTVNLGNSAANTGEAAGDTFTSIEAVAGSNFDDTLIGDSTGNSLRGMSGADVLNGAGGTDIADYFEASAGLTVSLTNPNLNTGEAAGDTFISIEGLGGSRFSDILTGDGGGNLLMGSGGADQLFGLDGSDTLNGDAGNDLLNGGAGIDTMRGGADNDTYIVDNASDKVLEAAGGGIDRVAASVGYVLAAGQEVERLDTTSAAGTTAINLTGNEFGQNIIGNAGVNTLDGKGGADMMQGLGGNDIYIVDNAGDKVLEAAGGGVDRVAASVGYVLAAGQEVERLDTTSAAGTTAINLTGNEFGQSIIGNAGANTLDGKGGADTMQGLAGNDTFVFRAGEAQGDKVLDFVGNGASAGDSIIFEGYGTAAEGATLVQLNATQWQINSADGLIHETLTLSNAAAIHNSDFLFV